MWQVFLVLLKKVFDLGEGFARERLAKWGVFVFMTTFDDPGRQSNGPKFWLELFLEAR